MLGYSTAVHAHNASAPHHAPTELRVSPQWVFRASGAATFLGTRLGSRTLASTYQDSSAWVWPSQAATLSHLTSLEFVPREQGAKALQFGGLEALAHPLHAAAHEGLGERILGAGDC